MPHQSIIDGFKGVLDFYYWNGIPCVRKWPTYTPYQRSASQLANQSAFAYINKLYRELPDLIIQALVTHASGTTQVSKDYLVRAYLKGLLDIMPAILPEHDHTELGDGGQLTAAIVDSFLDFLEQPAAPANPPANSARLYAREAAGITKLYYKQDDGTELEVGGAGPNGFPWSVWFPNAPPAAPSALDDEFDDDAFDPVLWTEFDPGAALTITEGDAGLYLDQVSQPGTKLAGPYQPIPGGNFTIWCRVSTLARIANSNSIGLALWDDATNPAAALYTHTLNLVAADEGVNIFHWTNYTTYSGTIGGRSVKGQSHIYLRIRRSSTTYAFDISSDGLGWLRIYSGALAFTPNHFGLISRNDGTGSPNRGVTTFFRYVASDLSLTGIMQGNRT